MKSLFRRKSLSALFSEAEELGEHTLKKTLSSWNLITLGIGGIIGAGIFTLTGVAAANYAGPGIVLSFVFAAVACVFAGLCYAELASTIPISGSAYTYAYASLGQFVAWVIGWDLILEYALGSVTVAIGWSGYFVNFLQNIGLQLPPEFSYFAGAKLIFYNGHWIEKSAGLLTEIANAGIDINTLSQTVSYFNVPAAFISILVSVVLMIGIKESANFNSVIVVLKLAIIVGFIVIGVWYVDPANWKPFIPEAITKVHNGITTVDFGWPGIFRGAAVVFFAYIGFDAVSTAAQEAKNPQKDIPVGILGSLVFCTILYILVSLVLTGIMHYSKLGVPHPIAYAIDAISDLKWFVPLIEVGAIAGLSSVILVLMLGQTRIAYSMSKDRMIPPGLGKLHPKFKTPYRITLIFGVLVAVAAGIMPISLAGELVSIGTLFAFIIVCAAVWIMRKRHPEMKRAFYTPYVPLVPILGILSCAYLMFSLPIDTWIRLIVWMVIGLFIYVGYSHENARKHSMLKK